MTWNFNMDEAPRGHFKKVTRTVNGKDRVQEKHVPEKIIATDGEIVTVSYWIPSSNKPPKHNGRWAMFATHEAPLAWMPFPKPPEAKAD